MLQLSNREFSQDNSRFSLLSLMLHDIKEETRDNEQRIDKKAIATLYRIGNCF